MIQDEHGYVLRLVVLKLEGALLPPPGEWPLPEDPGESLDPDFVDRLFPHWCRELDRSEPELRDDLSRLAKSGALSVRQGVRDLMDSLRNHSPVRVALLSTGPREWTRGLEEALELTDLQDLIYDYDRYPHGDRGTLLQFLMNRFIAGKGRTLLVGNTAGDARLARRESTRFASLSSPPGEPVEAPDRWNLSPRELEHYVQQYQPET